MSAKLKPALIAKPECEIEFNSWPRIAPETYNAYCRKASAPYWDKYFQRWQCLLQFDVLNESLEKIASAAWFLNLGKGEKPRAGTMSKFYAAWVKANDGKRPSRQDRMSSKIFERRYCRVVVEDTKKNYRQEAVFEDGAYSVVREAVSWNTGNCTDSSVGKGNDTQIKQSTNQPINSSIGQGANKPDSCEHSMSKDLGAAATKYLHNIKDNSRLEGNRKARLDEEWRQTKIKRQLDAGAESLTGTGQGTNQTNCNPTG